MLFCRKYFGVIFIICVNMFFFVNVIENVFYIIMEGVKLDFGCIVLVVEGWG